ncbi:MAG: GNAT family N-acetyltransferase [Candidatus Micrarchaeota archaeon]|nr:GNAT family N-acetyltransferase [Candidatus Micrarchaeota archaeon]
MAVTIRKMQERDIIGVRLMGFSTSEFDTGTSADTFYSRKTMLKWIKDQNGVAFSALSDNRVVGFILGNYLSASRGGYINTMVVDPEHRKQGVGKELLRRALSELQRKDCAHVFCAVEEENEAMLAFMRKSGFEVGRSFRYVERMLD